MSTLYINNFTNGDRLDVPLLSTAKINDFLTRHFSTLENNKDFFEVLPLLLKYEKLVAEYLRLMSEVIACEYQLKKFPVLSGCWTE